MIIVLVIIFVLMILIYHVYEMESSQESVWDDVLGSTDESEEEYQELYRNFNKV